MIEMSLEEDIPAEFRGGTLRLGAHPHYQSESKSGADKETGAVTETQSNCHWRNAFIAPLSSIPNKITETIWSSKAKDEPVVTVSASPPAHVTAAPSPQVAPIQNEKTLQLSSNIKHDPNNFFTYREGVVERAVRECVDQFMDPETEGPVLAYFLLTQINHWDTDKERLLMLTARHLFLIKYDFIALRRLGCRKVGFEEIEGIIIGNLVYPNGSLIPKINVLAEGLSSLMENCLFRKWSRSNDGCQDLDSHNHPRDRNMKGVRLLLRQEKPENLTSKWNPFNEDVPFLTFTYHPLFFHKDCTEEKRRNLYDIELFIEHLCLAVSKCKENSVILQHNVLLENYVGLGSVIHNRHSLGFFKVRGKFSF